MFGTLLRTERLNRGISQIQLSRDSGVPIDTICKIEMDGGSQITLAAAMRLAWALNLSVSDLCGDTYHSRTKQEETAK